MRKDITMKKIITILLSFVLLLSMTMTAFAADNQTEISLTLDETMESYEVVIPATIPVDLSQDETSFQIQIKNISLVWSDYVKVYVASANPDTESGLGAFLVNKEDATKKIHYRMYLPADYKGTETFVGQTSTNMFIGNVAIEVDGEFPGSGTYTDTLTFRVVAE